MSAITQDKQERKNAPMARGLLDYFPAALAAVAECSRKANEQHNPGEEMHWARDKSSDHADCIIRHLIERDAVDDDDIPHIVKVAWRALAAAQEYFEAQGATPGRASKWTAQESVQEGEFIPWKGGDNPAPGKRVDIRFRELVGWHATVQASNHCDWEWTGGASDIIEYRVIDDEG